MGPTKTERMPHQRWRYSNVIKLGRFKKRKEQRNRKEQRRKIKERMERKRQQERRRQERRREEEERQRLQQFQESKTTEILPPPNNNPADPKQPYG